MEEKEKASLSVDINKDTLLKFKSMCVLREHTMGEEIEKMITDWVALNQNPNAAPVKKPEAKALQDTAPAPPGKEDLSDQLEEQSEGA